MAVFCLPRAPPLLKFDFLKISKDWRNPEWDSIMQSKRQSLKENGHCSVSNMKRLVSGADTLPILERYRQYTELDTLTPAIAKELVQRVVVYPDSRLEVQLNCRDELEALLTGAISSDKTKNQETVNYTGGGIR